MKDMTTEDQEYYNMERRLRRKAKRQGLVLEKFRAKSPRAIDSDTYRLVSINDGALVAWGSTSGYGLTLDDVERCLLN